jgi:hypothetical protein
VIPVTNRVVPMQDAQRAHMAKREGGDSRAQLTTEQVAEIRRRSTLAYRKGADESAAALPVAPMTPITR